jgi:4,5-DOPA dioxygenase extradiol
MLNPKPMMTSLFVPHGSPMFALRPGAAGAALATLAKSLPQPRAIIMVSAHWETAIPTVGTADRLDTIHDFYGFPEALYALRYPATGCREAAAEVVQAIRRAGFDVAQDATRGLDHGAWVPLRLMFPDADVPVIPLSIQHHADAAHHLRLGQALAPLAAQGFLVIASGNLTHNLGDYQLVSRNGGGSPAYVREFADWMGTRMAAHDTAALIDYRHQAPGAVQAHPSEEHLLPLFVALGAGGEQADVSRFHAGIDDYVLAMDAFAFSPQTKGVQ